MSVRAWSEEQIAEIRIMQLAEVPYSVIAARYNTSRGAISGLMNRNGFSTASGQPAVPRYWSADKLIQLKELLDSGMTQKAAGAEMGVSGRAVASQVQLNKWKIAAIVNGSRFTNRGRPPSGSVIPFQRRGKTYAPTKLREVIAPEEMLANAVSFHDLRPCHCRWPIQDKPLLFCGGQHDEVSSYCAYHHFVATDRRAG